LAKGFTRARRLRSALADLRQHLGTAPAKFTLDVVEEFEDLVRDFDPTPPSHRRIMLRGGTTHLYSHLSELALMLEGLAFFAHLVDRLAFRGANDAVRDACDPLVRDAAKLVSDIIGTADDRPADLHAVASPDDVLRFLDRRGLEYSAAKVVLGDSVDDENGVFGLASITIAKAIDAPAAPVLRTVVSIALMQGFKRVEWSRLVNDVEANL
jgi:hypothetical protein